MQNFIFWSLFDITVEHINICNKMIVVNVVLIITVFWWSNAVKGCGLYEEDDETSKGILGVIYVV
jgi:hypothetical protein